MAENALSTALLKTGVELHYVQLGSGDTVVFVHGSTGDYRAWEGQLKPFARKHHVVSYSRRYHAPNDWVGDGTDYTASLHADDLIALIEALARGPVHVVGNSFGAYTILVAATRRPDLMRKLVIGEPPILAWLKEIPGGQPYWDSFMSSIWEPAGRTLRAGDLENGVKMFIDGVMGRQGLFDSFPPPVRSRILENARSLAAETASPGYLSSITPQQVGQIPNPMLLVRGERSPKMFHLIMDRLVESAPSARSVTVPQASHAIPSNNPPAYNQAVLEFLSEGEASF